MSKTRPNKTPAKTERRQSPDRPRRARAIELVVRPPELRCPVDSTYEGDVFVWDLDKTYLRSEFGSLKDLVRTAFEKARDKVAYPGATPLLRGLRRDLAGRLRPIYFVSASPPQMREKVLEKLAIDGVEIDGIYFKDNIQNVRPGRMKRLREQMGYKLLALLDLRRHLPQGAVETMFGDDSETDASVYSTYSEILEGALGGGALVELLDKQGVFHDESVRIAWRARSIGRRAAVRRVFITMHKSVDPRYFHRFGSRVTGIRSYFQTALLLAIDGVIDVETTAKVADEILARRPALPTDLAREIRELRRQRSLDSPRAADVLSKLGALGLLPPMA